MSDTRKIYSVSELTRRIKSVLESDVGSVWLEGELSNVRRPVSGHVYFTLKDETAQIAGVLFRGSQRGMRVQPRDGTRVRVFGEITVYERSGSYQVVVRLMEESGKGNLQARFEELKKKLADEGLFEAARKRPIPLLPRHVGLVTSRTGAAVRDILNVLGRRFPNLHVILAPVRVQGEGAAEEIAAAIDALNRHGVPEVLIVGRGGGSIEDLWAFNEEVVARAIARSRIPVISAVGHEIDFTISDFVADLRAPTPSAAAELVVGQKEAFERTLEESRRRLARSLQTLLLRSRARLLAAAGQDVFRQPANVLRAHRNSLERCELRMGHALRGTLREGQQVLDDHSLRLAHAVRLRQQARRMDLRRLATQLRALNPLAVLTRGYSVTRDGDGHIIRSAADVRAGQRVRTRVASGEFDSDVVSCSA